MTDAKTVAELAAKGTQGEWDFDGDTIIGVDECLDICFVRSAQDRARLIRVPEYEALIAEQADALDSEGEINQSLSARNAELEAENARLRGGLTSLSNEVFGMTAFELELRQVMGNSNWNCIMHRAEQARAALTEGQDDG